MPNKILTDKEMAILTPKQIGIEYCKRSNLIVPFFSKKVNKVFDEALDIVIKKTEQKCIKRFNEIIDEFEQRLFDDVIWKERFGILFHKEVEAQVIRFKQKLNSK